VFFYQSAVTFVIFIFYCFYPESDPDGTEIIAKAMGNNGKQLAAAVDHKYVKPSRRAMEKMQGQNPE
jgi:hypothetical protein